MCSSVRRIASGTNIDRPVFGFLVTGLVTALKTWAPLSHAARVEPQLGDEAATDAGPVWEVLMYIAQNSSGRHHMLAMSAFDLTNRGHVDEARSAEVDAARTLGLFLTEALHQAPTVRRAMSVLKALVADTTDSAGCASQLLLLSYNAGLLLVSLSMALQALVAERAVEAGGLPCLPMNSTVGLYSAEKAMDCGRHTMLKLLGAGNQYKDLTRWVTNAHALTEAEGLAVQQMLAGMVVVLSDAAAIAAGASSVPAATVDGAGSSRRPTLPADARCICVCFLPLLQQIQSHRRLQRRRCRRGEALTSLLTRRTRAGAAGAAEVAQPQDEEAATWAMSVTLDALHHVAGVAPGHKLLACVGSSLPQLLRGLAHIITRSNLMHAMKALQLMLVLARADQGPLLEDSEGVEAMVTALSTRLVRLPVQDPNEEQLMLLATDCLHLCFDRPHGDALLHELLLTGQSAEQQQSGGSWGSWLGFQHAAAPSRRRACAQEHFLTGTRATWIASRTRLVAAVSSGLRGAGNTGLAHALHLEDLSVGGKALELMVRALHHPGGAGYRLFLQLQLDPVHTVCRISVLMQAWPYQTRHGSRTFADYKVCRPNPLPSPRNTRESPHFAPGRG